MKNAPWLSDNVERWFFLCACHGYTANNHGSPTRIQAGWALVDHIHVQDRA